MSESKARAARAARVEQGLSPFADPVHNFLPEEAEDTRADRRKKKFKPKAYEAELRSSSPRRRQAEINRWNRALTASAQALAEKRMMQAADKALKEMEAEEEADNQTESEAPTS